MSSSGVVFATGLVSVFWEKGRGVFELKWHVLLLEAGYWARIIRRGAVIIDARRLGCAWYRRPRSIFGLLVEE